MDLVARRRSAAAHNAQRSRPGAAVGRLRRRRPGPRLCREEDDAEGGAVRSAGRRRARQHLRVRGAASRPALAATSCVDDRDPGRRAPPRRARPGRGDQARVERRRQTQHGDGAAGRQRIGSGRRVFPSRFRVYDRERRAVPRDRGAAAGCGESCRGGRSTFYCPTLSERDRPSYADGALFFAVIRMAKAGRPRRENVSPQGQHTGPGIDRPSLLARATIGAALCALVLVAYSNAFSAGFALDSRQLVLNDTRVHAVTAENIDLILHRSVLVAVRRERAVSAADDALVPFELRGVRRRRIARPGITGSISSSTP